MRRRRFLKSAASLTAGSVCAGADRLFAREDAPAWRTFEITVRVEMERSPAVTRLWLPTGLVGKTPFQKTLSNEFSAASGTAKVVERKTDGCGILVAEFPAGVAPVLTLTTRAATKNFAVDLTRPNNATKNARRVELDYWIQPTRMIPTSGIVKAKSDEITRGARTDVEKARATYEWIVENTFRNPKTRGCGLGDIRFLLESGDLSGKCADLNALFVGLVRAAGIPAREVFGIRTAKSELGYKSLGASSENVTKAQHCRAEVYLNGYGWVPVDPADVRKVVLEEPPGNRSLSDEVVRKARERLFGSWEMNWVAYNFAHDVALPGSSARPLPFFMYPQAEVGTVRLDSLDPDSFKYEIIAKHI